MRLISLFFMIIFLSACSSMAYIDYDKNFHFQKLKTFTVQKNAEGVADDPRINTPFMQQRIVEAIETNLLAKGFVKTIKQGDITIKYYLDVKQDIETESSSVSLGFGSAGRHSAVGFGFIVPVGEAYSIDKLILTIDMIAADSNKLTWRGSLANRLATSATPQTITVYVNKLVAAILENFPPKK